MRAVLVADHAGVVDALLGERAVGELRVAADGESEQVAEGVTEAATLVLGSGVEGGPVSRLGVLGVDVLDADVICLGRDEAVPVDLLGVHLRSAAQMLLVLEEEVADAAPTEEARVFVADLEGDAVEGKVPSGLLSDRLGCLGERVVATKDLAGEAGEAVVAGVRAELAQAADDEDEPLGGGEEVRELLDGGVLLKGRHQERAEGVVAEPDEPLQPPPHRLRARIGVGGEVDLMPDPHRALDAGHVVVDVLDGQLPGEDALGGEVLVE